MNFLGLQVDTLFEAGVVSTWDDADLLAPVACGSRRARWRVRSDGRLTSYVATCVPHIIASAHMQHTVCDVECGRQRRPYVRHCTHALVRSGPSLHVPRAEVEGHAPHVPLHEGLEGAEWHIVDHSDAEEDDNDGDEGGDDGDGPDRSIAPPVHYVTNVPW